MTKEEKIQFIKRFLAGDAMNAFRLSGPTLLKSILGLNKLHTLSPLNPDKNEVAKLF